VVLVTLECDGGILECRSDHKSDIRWCQFPTQKWAFSELSISSESALGLALHFQLPKIGAGLQSSQGLDIVVLAIRNTEVPSAAELTAVRQGPNPGRFCFPAPHTCPQGRSNFPELEQGPTLTHVRFSTCVLRKISSWEITVEHTRCSSGNGRVRKAVDTSVPRMSIEERPCSPP